MPVESLESRQLLAADVVFDLPSTGVYDLSVQAGDLIIRDDTGAVLVQQATGDVETLTIHGTSGDDTIRIVETADGLPQFAGDLTSDEGFRLSSFVASGFANAAGNQNVGLHFEAGAGDDMLELVMSNTHTVSYFVGTADPTDATQKRGNLNVADQLTLSFDGLTPQVVPGSGGILRVDGSADPSTTTLTVRDDTTDLAGPGGMLVAGDGGFETVFFNGFNELVIIGGDGPETIELADFDPATSLTSITLDGDNNAGTDVSPDNFVLTSLPAGITANLFGGAGDDLFSVDQSTGFVALGNIHFDGGDHTLGDSFQFTGDGVETATILPDSVLSDATTVDYGPNRMSFQNVEVSLIGGVSAATYITPNQVDNLVIQEISAGGTPVLTFTGTSDGVVLATPILASVPVVTIDTGTNDATDGTDTIVYDNLETPAGLLQMNLVTGAFEDTITIASVAPDTALFVDAGTENDFVQIGTVDFGLNDIQGGINVQGGDQDLLPEFTDSVTAAGVIFDIDNLAGDTLRVVDFPTTFDSAYSVADGAIEAFGLPLFHYGQTETLELITGQGNNQIDVVSTPANSTLRIQASNLAELVSIFGTGAGSIVDISTFDGDDQVGITETGVESFVRLDTGAGMDQLLVRDTGGGAGLIASLGDDSDLALVQRSSVTSVVSILGEGGSDSLVLGFVANGSGSANIEVDGGADDDLLDLSPEVLGSNALLVGGDGVDTLHIEEETSNFADTYALDASSITKTEGGDAFSAMFDTVEVVQLETGQGADVITVTPATGIQFEIDGGFPAGDRDVPPGDRLIPIVDGLTNVVIPPTGTSGVITADGVGDIVFADIELLPREDPPIPTDGDRFEANETFATATVLGSEPVATLRDVDLNDADDVDVYRITAHDSGKLIVNVRFSQASGNVDLQLLDGNGTPLATGDSLSDNEFAVIPVVSQEDYFIRIFSPTSETNEYTLEIENFAAPVPVNVDLDAESDTGTSNSDGITSDSTPRLLVQADLRDFANMGIGILDASAATAGQAGAGVIVRLTDPTTGTMQSGFANPVGTSEQLWEFIPGSGLADGTYLASASVVVIDGQRPAPAAGDTSLSPATRFTIDSLGPTVSTPEIAVGFDTGMDATDNVTFDTQPLLFGFTDAFASVSIQALNVDSGTANFIATANADQFGRWQVNTPSLANGTYRFLASATNLAGVQAFSNESETIVIDSIEPNAARITLLSDNGQSTTDTITSINRPVVSLTAGDVDGPSIPHDGTYRLYLLPDGSATETLVVDAFAETGGFVDGGSFSHTLSLDLNSPAGAALPDGTHTLRLEVEDRAGNITQAESLVFTIDTTAPALSFGNPAIFGDGLRADSDSGIQGDRLTNDTIPTFWGMSEAGTLLESFVITDGGFVTIGQAVTTTGVWELTSFVDLKDPHLGFGRDGSRTIVLRGSDVAGNITEDIELEIFIDVDGPRVRSVTYLDGRSVFDPKATDGPTPLTRSLLVTLDEDIMFESGSLTRTTDAAATLDAGNWSIVGDATGQLFIDSVQRVGEPSDGAVTVRLDLAASIPDDRLTLTIRDRITDVAGNPLDGDTRASEPGPVAMLLPSGDGVPSGDFVARMTVDALPEIGTWNAGSVYIDTNGNFTFDPENPDDTNEDIVYTLGFPSDDVFAGNFVADVNGIADGFDKIAAYGDVGLSFESPRFRWLVDVNHDGAVEPADGDIHLADSANVNGLPVAGRFDTNDVNGDEVSSFTGSVWWMDTDHDFQLDSQLDTDLRGYPIVGDFDGDGFDDLGTYNEAEDQFEFDLTAGTRGSWDGTVDAAVAFGFAGVRERPVAADFDGDTIDDIGLWVPDRSGQAPEAAGEWYILVSSGESIFDRVVTEQQLDVNTVRFTPQPFGNDLFAQFGDEFSLPVVGNFDPPVRTGSTVFPLHNESEPYDVNNDGAISPVDALLVVNSLGGNSTVGSYADTNRDGIISPLDALGVINALSNTDTSLSAKAPLSSAVAVAPTSAAMLDSLVGMTPLAEERTVATDVVFGRETLGDVPRTQRATWQRFTDKESAQSLIHDERSSKDSFKLAAIDSFMRWDVFESHRPFVGR